MYEQKDNFISFAAVYGVEFYALGKKSYLQKERGRYFPQKLVILELFSKAKYFIKSFLFLGQIFDWQVIQVKINE